MKPLYLGFRHVYKRVDVFYMNTETHIGDFISFRRAKTLNLGYNLHPKYEMKNKGNVYEFKKDNNLAKRFLKTYQETHLLD
jgi:hypothetical protein